MTNSERLRAVLTPEKWDNFCAIERDERNNKVDLETMDSKYPVSALLACSFVWDATPQGHEYWSTINMRLSGVLQ